MELKFLCFAVFVTSSGGSLLLSRVDLSVPTFFLSSRLSGSGRFSCLSRDGPSTSLRTHPVFEFGLELGLGEVFADDGLGGGVLVLDGQVQGSAAVV